MLHKAVVTGNNKRPVKIPFAPVNMRIYGANVGFSRKNVFVCDANEPLYRRIAGADVILPATADFAPG